MYNVSINRRQFFKRTIGLMAGLSSFSLCRPARIRAITPELTMLSVAHFVPASDEKLKELADRFAREQGVVIRIDHLPQPQVPPKLAAEIHAQAGHDIVWMFGASPWLYHEHLVDVDDVIQDLGEKQEGWYPFAKENDFVVNSWKAIPWFWHPYPGLYREDLFGQIGLSAPQSWEDLLNAGKVLRTQGHPVGIPISQCFDATLTVWSILWGFGAKVLEADGKTLALRSPETEAALTYYKSLYEEAMEPEVLSWDDAGNNRFLLSGKGSWIQNPISAYISAVDRKMGVADKIGIHSVPTGPAGKHVALAVHALGIWKFSKNQELAKAFIRYLLRPENYTEWIVAARGYNHGPLRIYENHSIWAENPKFKILPKEAQSGHAFGWPSPPNSYVQRINDLYILPNMAARVVTGTSVKAAIVGAEEQIRKVLES